MDTNSLPQSGIIYIFEKADGTRLRIPVEQTPDDITTLPTIKPPVNEPEAKNEAVVKKYDPREELSSIAFTPIPEKPKFDPFGFPMGKPGANPFGAPGGFGKPGTFPPFAKATSGRPPFAKATSGRPFPGAKPKPFPPFAKASGGMGKPVANPFGQMGGMSPPFAKATAGKPFPKPQGTAQPFKPVQMPAAPQKPAPKPFSKPITVSGPKAAPPASGATPVVPESQTRPHQAPDAGDAAGNPLAGRDLPATTSPQAMQAGDDKIRVNPNDDEPVLDLPVPHALNHVSVPDAPDLPKPLPETPTPPSPVVLPFGQNKPIQDPGFRIHDKTQTQPDTRERSASTSDIERPFTPKKSGKGGGWGTGGSRLGMALIALSLGGLLAPQIPKLRLEAAFKAKQAKEAVVQAVAPPTPFPEPEAIVFDPLVNADGSAIVPINTDFALIVPKIGINAPVIANVNPAEPADYKSALKAGVAHSVTSFTPDKHGTTYLFSHSTNYEWFIDDLNAIFYLLKELEEGDLIVVVYKGVRYTYKLTGTKVVKPNQISYLSPRTDGKKLILQTCWPPGSVKERLLVFADLIDEQPYQAHFEAIAATPTPVN